MKTTKIIAIATAIATLVACSKEAETSIDANHFEKGQKVTLTVKAGEPSTRVSSELDTTSGAVDFKWQTGDKIKVTIGTESAEFTLSSGEGESTATFTGTMPSSGNTFSVQYPVGDSVLTTQTYSDTEALPHDKMLFSASGCSTSEPFTLEPQYAALRLNLWGNNQTVSKIIVKNNSTSDTYTLNISTGVALPEDKADSVAFFVVVPAGAYSFSANVIGEVSSDAASGTTAPDNDCIIKHLFTIIAGTTSNTFSSSTLTFEAGKVFNMPAKEVAFTLPTKVYFSKGNLYYDGSAWGFEANQYDFRTYEGKNSCIGGTLSDTGTPTGNWGAFGWVSSTASSVTANTYGMSTNTDNLQYAQQNGGYLKDNWANITTLPQIDGRSWYTLNINEWAHVVSNRKISVGGYSKAAYGEATVNNVKGIILLPDDWDGSVCSSFSYGDQNWANTFSGSTTPTWEAMQNAGCVFLPAVGKRNGANMSDFGSRGFYRSTTPDGKDYSRVFWFGQYELFTNLSHNNYLGLSVRLVSKAQ